jgi:hypothetical protein
MPIVVVPQTLAALGGLTGARSAAMAGRETTSAITAIHKSVSVRIRIDECLVAVMKSTRTVANPAHDRQRQQIGLHSMLKVRIIMILSVPALSGTPAKPKLIALALLSNFFAKGFWR